MLRLFRASDGDARFSQRRMADDVAPLSLHAVGAIRHRRSGAAALGGSSKFEVRSSKQYRMFEEAMSETALRFRHCSLLLIRICFGFRYSNLEIQLPRSRLLDLDQVRHEHLVGVAERFEEEEVE